MRYLTDSEILKWNDRLSESKFSLIPRMNNRNGYPDIVVSIEEHSGMPGLPLFKSGFESPVISYLYSFSIVSHREEEFFRIFDRLCKENFSTKLLTIDNQNKESLVNIDLNKSFIEKCSIEEHELLNRKFRKYTFNFESVLLTDIICFLTYIEDTIECFQLLWGYDSNGNEVSLLDFTIGSVVSMKRDKSKDYLVIDYNFIRVVNSYKINYVLSEVLYDDKSPIIKYGKTIKSDGSDICYSRNNRIDNILN